MHPRFRRLHPLVLAAAAMLLAPVARADYLHQECGTVIQPGSVWRLNRYDAMMSLSRPEGPPPPRCVPLKIHIVRASDHTGGIPLSQITQGIADVNAAYTPMNMTFYRLAAIDYIDNDAYYNHSLTDPEVIALKGVNWVAHVVNCYFVPQLGYCGVANFPGDAVQGIVFLNDCVGLPSNPSTFPHEIGHYFGLYHTHETVFGAELVNESNCATAGDKLCDTPADPDLSNPGFVGPNCTYTGNAMDSNGDSYNPDMHQYMSYSDKTCRNVFSPMSQAKVLAVLTSSRADHINCPPVANAGGNRTVECASSTTTPVTLNGSGSSDPDGTPVTFAWSAPGVTFDDPSSATPTGGFPLGTTVVTLTVSSDGADVTTTITVTIVDTTAPTVSCPTDLTLPCDSHCDPSLGGVPASDAAVVAWLASFTATDVCDPSPTTSLPHGACFPLGDTPLTFTATDHSGNSATCTRAVHVVDTTPPTITVSLDRTSLWPPNHKLVTINATVAVSDVCDPNPTFQLVSIVSSEPDNGLGDGDTANDIQGASYGTPDTQFQLRSERSGTGPGRTYTITYRASDHSGNHADVVVVVRVAHDQGAAAQVATGWDEDGTGFAPNSTQFAMVVRSIPRTLIDDSDPVDGQIGTLAPTAVSLQLDTRMIDVGEAYVGNTAGAVAPVAVSRGDVDGDGLQDLVCFYDVQAVLTLEGNSTAEDGPIGLHFAVGAMDYLVPDIFACGSPLVLPNMPRMTVAGGGGRGTGRAASGQAPAGIAASTRAPADGGAASRPTTWMPPALGGAALVTELAGVYPNPVRSSARIEWSLAAEDRVELAIFDIRGARVRTLASGRFAPGRYSASWDGRSDGGRSAGSGIYFVRLSAGRYTRTIKTAMMP